MLKRLLRWGALRSPWILHVNTGSCNNCDIELIDTLTPRFDAERFGVLLEGPRQADVLAVTGFVSRQAALKLRELYEEVPPPKKVVAIGTCACSGGIFKKSYNFAGPVDRIIPVDVYVTGCPPRPQAIIDGLIKALTGG